MNRNKKLILNGAIGVIKQLITMLCGFILQRYMILAYGSSANGLVSSVTHFLSFITFLEMGIGPVIQANLYAPLAKKDNVVINQVVVSSDRFFRRIGFVLIAYTAVLMVLFPTVINTEEEPLFLIAMVFVLSLSSFAQYFFGATNQLLLNADQKAYVQNILQFVSTILNTIACIVLIKLNASIIVTKLFSSLVFLIRPVFQVIYVKKHYEINRKVKVVGEPIKQKWNGFAQHVAAVVCKNTDVVILTIFASLSLISVYNVHYYVINGITETIMLAAVGVEAFFGNILAKGEKKQLNQSFSVIEFITHVGVSILFAVTITMIVPFVKIYTAGITDADYIQPIFAILLSLAYACQCLRIPYFRLIKAAGRFKETQNGAFISAGLNLVVSLVLIFNFGLIGVAIGTLVALLYHTIYFVFYLKKHIIYRPVVYFFKYLISDMLIIGATYILGQLIGLECDNYLVWALKACIIFALSFAISVIVSFIFNGKTFIFVLSKIKVKFSHKKAGKNSGESNSVLAIESDSEGNNSLESVLPEGNGSTAKKGAEKSQGEE